MPDACMANTIVVGATSGHVRTAKSWILGKLLKDLEDGMDEEMKDEQAHVPPGEIEKQAPAVTIEQVQSSAPRRTPREALRVTIFEVDEGPPCQHGVPTLDWVWFSSLAVILVQLVTSLIPWLLNGGWSTFMITLSGNALALIQASLPQWRAEKWACPKKGGSTVTLTQGNGSRHAVVILGKKGVGLDLEILAQGTRVSRTSWVTNIAAVLALLWIVLLITVADLKQNAWCTLATHLVVFITLELT